MAVYKTLLALTACPLLLAACGGGDSPDGGSTADCGAQYNPASSVQASYSSLDIKEPARLERHLFHNIIAGVQPEPADTYGQAVADDVHAITARFNGGQPATGQAPYTSVRNPLDFLNLVIGEGSIENFNVGRNYISTCVDADNAALYSSSSNGALISVEENREGKTTDVYSYPNLRWVYSPDTSGKVIRVIRFQGRNGEDLNGAAVGIQYDDTDFSAAGFNTPELVQASFTAGNNQERLGLEQALIGMDKDQWIRSSDNTFDFADQSSVDCARVIVDYRLQQAEVFTSTYTCSAGDEAAETCPTRGEYVQSDDYCGNFEEGTGTTYSTQAVPERQK